MSDEPTVGPSSTAPGNAPTRDAGPVHPSSNATQTIAPTSDTFSTDASQQAGDSLPALPDLSMGVGTTPAASRPAPEPPKLDGYNVITAIGEGGMGTVWRAVQLSTRRSVAIKLISTAALASERARLRFDREVEITARLEHPNIARVYDSGLNRGVYFYAMELIDGVPLDQFVSRKQLSRPQILRLFALVCRAVDHAHLRGVIHRDLKPGNILVSPDGQPHVLDFGLAKALLQAGKEAGVSIDGEVAGTPGFMAPEQAGGKLDIDARCDVYSLGVILYRLLTGQSPHDLTGTYLDVLRRVSEEEPKRPRLADKTMDRELEALLLRALQRDPSHRYKTAGELAHDVESYLAGDPISAKPPTVIYFFQKRVRKHRIKLATIGIVVLLVSLAALLTIRLVGSHKKTIDETKQKEINLQRALEENRKGNIANGNGLVSTGDKLLASSAWSEARVSYLKAADYYNSAGVSPLKAQLGLWDLARTAPPPLLTIPWPSARSTAGSAAAAVAMSATPAILDDSRRALVGYDDGTVRLLDLATGRTMQTIAAHPHPVRSVAASRDGQLAMTGSDEGALKLWDLDTGNLKAVFTDPEAPLKNRVTHVAISPDGRLALSVSGATVEAMASSTYNDTLTLWDVAGGRPLVRTDRPASVLDVKKTVTQAAFSPDSSRFVTSSAEVVVWNAKDGKRAAVIPNTATAVAFPADGHTVVAGASDGSVRLLDLETKQITLVQKTGSVILAIWFDSQRQQVITSTEDTAFRAIDLAGGEIWSQPPRGDLNGSVISHDGTLALTAADEGLSVWRLSPPPEARELALGGPFANVALSSDGRLALARSARRGFSIGAAASAILFDTATGKPLTPSGFPADRCNGIAMSRDGRTIAQVMGSVLAVWSVDPPHEIRRFIFQPARGLAEAVAVAISDDGTKVALSTADNSVLLYRVAAAERVKLIGHTAAITSLSLSGDGHLILTGSEDQTARIWNADTGAVISVLRGHEAAINAVALSQDGTFAVTGSGAAMFQGGNDNSVRVWDIPSVKLVLTLPPQAGRVRSVAISGNGQLIAAGSDDQTVTLYDRVTGDTLRTLRSQHGTVVALSFDQTGKTLLCGGETLALWNFGLPAREQGIVP